MTPIDVAIEWFRALSLASQLFFAVVVPLVLMALALVVMRWDK